MQVASHTAKELSDTCKKLDNSKGTLHTSASIDIHVLLIAVFNLSQLYWGANHVMCDKCEE